MLDQELRKHPKCCKFLATFKLTLFEQFSNFFPVHDDLILLPCHYASSKKSKIAGMGFQNRLLGTPNNLFKRHLFLFKHSRQRRRRKRKRKGGGNTSPVKLTDCNMKMVTKYLL